MDVYIKSFVLISKTTFLLEVGTELKLCNFVPAVMGPIKAEVNIAKKSLQWKLGEQMLQHLEQKNSTSEKIHFRNWQFQSGVISFF